MSLSVHSLSERITTFLPSRVCMYFDFKNNVIILTASKTQYFFMNLLQIFFIISGTIILLIAFDIARRERFNALHFLVFLGAGIGLLIFTFFPGVLDYIGHIFGLARGADVLVYASIVFLYYFVLLLLRKTESNREELTRIIREFALENAKK